MKIKTRECPVCHQTEEYEVEEEQYRKWNRGMLIQKAFPDMTKDQRERLKTGLHGECWNKYLGVEQ